MRVCPQPPPTAPNCSPTEPYACRRSMAQLQWCMGRGLVTCRGRASRPIQAPWAQLPPRDRSTTSSWRSSRCALPAHACTVSSCTRPLPAPAVLEPLTLARALVQMSIALRWSAQVRWRYLFWCRGGAARAAQASRATTQGERRATGEAASVGRGSDGARTGDGAAGGGEYGREGPLHGLTHKCAGSMCFRFLSRARDP